LVLSRVRNIRLKAKTDAFVNRRRTLTGFETGKKTGMKMKKPDFRPKIALTNQAIAVLRQAFSDLRHPHVGLPVLLPQDFTPAPKKD
jgi:hypothetical protein